MKSLHKSWYIDDTEYTCLATVQEDGDTDGFLDCYFLSLLQGYGFVIRYPMRKPAEGSRSELYPLLDFVIQITVRGNLGKYTAKIGEFVQVIERRACHREL